jgi:hypothetical protein
MHPVPIDSDLRPVQPLIRQAVKENTELRYTICAGRLRLRNGEVVSLPLRLRSWMEPAAGKHRGSASILQIESLTR